MSIKLDFKDMKLLHELDKNARQTNLSLAKKIGLSKDAVVYRIKQLEKKGVIRGYRTVLDFGKIGYIHYRILLRLVNVTESALNQLIKLLQEENNVWIIGVIEGEWDVSFTYLARTELEFYNFFENLKQQYRHIMKEQLISQLLKYDEVERYYLLDEAPKPKSPPKIIMSKIEIDTLDHEILAMLSTNARMKLIEIANKLHQSSMLILQRIKKLEQNKVILGYKVDLDVLSLGRDYYGIKIILDNYSQKDAILKEIYSMKEMSAVIYTLGGYDLEFDLEIPDTKRFHEILGGLRTKFHSIREIKQIRTINYYKLTHKPKKLFN